MKKYVENTKKYVSFFIFPSYFTIFPSLLALGLRKIPTSPLYRPRDLEKFSPPLYRPWVLYLKALELEKIPSSAPYRHSL
mgnify:CR=1 FL=1